MSSRGAVFDHVVEWLQHYQEAIQPAISLELGAGAGQYADVFKSGRYVGFDVPETWYQPKRSLDLYASADHLPFSEDTFDLAFCVAAFDYLPRPERVLQEVARCLRETGVFLIFTYDTKTLRMIHENTKQLTASRAVAHHHVFDQRLLGTLGASAGLRMRRLPLFPSQGAITSLKRRLLPGNLRNYEMTKCP